jgi:hypothetical protein
MCVIFNPWKPEVHIRNVKKERKVRERNQFLRENTWLHYTDIHLMLYKETVHVHSNN